MSANKRKRLDRNPASFKIQYPMKNRVKDKSIPLPGKQKLGKKKNLCIMSGNL
jgi:hypothetical protein